MKRILALTFSSLLLLSMLVTPAKADPACGSVEDREVVYLIMDGYGAVSVVRIITTTCCVENGEMSCWSYTTYEF